MKIFKKEELPHLILSNYHRRVMRRECKLFGIKLEPVKFTVAYSNYKYDTEIVNVDICNNLIEKINNSDLTKAKKTRKIKNIQNIINILNKEGTIKKLNYTRESLKVSDNRIFFSVMRHRQATLFRYIKRWGNGILSNGYYIYNKEATRLRDVLLTMELQFDTRYRFCSYLSKIVGDCVPTIYSVLSSAEEDTKICFNQFKRLKRYEKLLLRVV